jgi:hypothetical protein
MGWEHMQTTEKRREKASINPFFLLSTSLVVKKTHASKNEPATNVDFHLEVVRKIDELLKDTKPQRPTSTTTAIDQMNRMPPPVEERSPFSRRPGHEEITFDASASPLSRPRPIPNEFKTDFPIGTNPAFRFVTSLDSIQDLVLSPRPDPNRIEIINLNTLRDKSSILRMPEETDDDEVASPHHVHDDIAFLSAMASETPDTQTDRSQLYTLQAKNKNKQDDYIPDLSERIQQIRERQQQEEQHTKEEQQRQQAKEQQRREEEEAEQRRQQEIEAKKQKEREEKERKKQQLKKTEPQKEPATTEPKPGLFHRAKPQTPPEEPEEPASCDEEPEEPQEPEDEEPDIAITPKFTKHEQKLAARQAKLELKKQKQHEKLQQKQRRKQEKLKSKNTKHNKQKQPKPIKKATQKIDTRPISELDEDLLRFLELTDTLLGQLPEDVIERFANSEDFQLYEKIMAKYHLK